jgi:hypothetical protein
MVLITERGSESEDINHFGCPDRFRIGLHAGQTVPIILQESCCGGLLAADLRVCEGFEAV